MVSNGYKMRGQVYVSYLYVFNYVKCLFLKILRFKTSEQWPVGTWSNTK